MVRSVSYPSGSLVAFTVREGEDSDARDFEYEWLRDDLIERAKRLFPSLEPYDGWRGREDHILARNAFADFGVSVYGDLVAVWIVERDDGSYRDADWQAARSSRARHWLRQIASRFEAEFGDYDCLGHFSNGVGVYRKREPA
jgi:hypothetical protein